ncbi:hypothetical protein KIN20_000913 [Parelaphostrongylus tenuis]|uniref:Uncharacterized protein n=1 Tax=Parelaphostrongylus tenuis TaxID=148309 RepID=A0AAD5LSV6_PARTN|nr:hypothetical protein KIN20_000913 [Parelaphostrongylus tenuis]
MSCLKPAELRFVHDHFTRWLWQYLFPLQFTLGVLGNILNLCVLASDETSNVASDLMNLSEKTLATYAQMEHGEIASEEVRKINGPSCGRFECD